MELDEQVSSAISAVFHAFPKSGTTYGVVRHFAFNSLLIPKRAYGYAVSDRLRLITGSG